MIIRKKLSSGRPASRVLTALVLVLALVAAGCSQSGAGGGTTSAGSTDGTGSPDTSTSDEMSEAEANARSVYEEYSTMSGAEREESLTACAVEAGGDITVYTSNSAIDSIIEGFEEKFPDLAVNTYRATPAAFIQRFFAEQEAGYYGVDVVEDADVTLVTQAGLAGDYINPELTDQIRGLEDVQGQFIPTRMGAFVVSWNTDAVDESEIPDSLEGFTDPKWDGRLSIADADWPWYMALYRDLEDQGWTSDEVNEMFTTLASYADIVPSHTLQAQLLGAGEHDVGLTTFNHSVDLLAEEGAPVTWKRRDGSSVEPIVFHQEGAVPVVNAPNPCGALLFIDYFLTGGQEIMASLFRPTSIPQGQADLFEGNRQIFVPIDEYFNNRDDWEPTWLEFLEQGNTFEE